MYEKLLSEGKIGNLTIRNRMVMEPMGNGYSNAAGEATEKDVAFYAERAKGGCGLILTETLTVQKGRGGGNDKQMTLADDAVIPTMRKLVEAVHENGAVIIPEIYHAGRQGGPDNEPSGTSQAPSAVECQLTHIPCHEMSLEEIKQMIADFAAAARRAKEAGFDGVEIHCAHGYLLNQFLSPYSNRRTDEYGGSTENRCRIVREIIEAIRAEVGPDFPLLARVTVDEMLNINGIDDGITLDEGVHICQNLESYGVDALDISCGIYETMNVSWEPVGFKQGWKKHLAAAVKQAVSVPVFCTSVIRDPAYAEQLLDEGVCDFVGSARTWLADAHWGLKAQEGRTNEICRCISCLNCMESMMSPTGSQCSVNVMSGHEFEWNDLKKDGDGRTVVVVGAGPAGLEAAHTLARRGFKPIILEAKSEVGGQLCYARKPPEKYRIQWFIEYQRAMLEKHDIEVRLDTPATLELLKELDPYAIIWAVGSSPVMPRSIKGIDNPCVLKTTDILSEKIQVFGKKICVVGSGMTGIETADFLSERDNQIDVYEMLDDIGPGLFFQNIIDIMGRIMPRGVGLHPKSKLVEIGDGWADFESTETGELTRAEFDYLVLSLGTRPNDLPEDIAAAYPNLVKVGDADKPGRIRSAIEAGFLAARAL